MSEPIPVAHAEIVRDLAHALFVEGRRFYRPAQDIIPVIVAAYLIEHLERDGFVVMKKPPIGGHALNSWMPPK